MVSVRSVAVLLVVLGAVALLVPSFASEGFITERPTAFAIGADDKALIGSEETGRTVTHPAQGPRTATAVRLTNNFDSELALSYRVQTDLPAVQAAPQRDTVRLLPGESVDITVECAPGGGGSETAVVTATVESAYADGIGIENAVFDFQVEYDCSPPAQTGNTSDGGGPDGGSGQGPPNNESEPP